VLPHLATVWLCRLGCGLEPSPVSAQIRMPSGAYPQNFDSLASVGNAIPWTNSITLPGWYPTVTEYNSGEWFEPYRFVLQLRGNAPLALAHEREISTHPKQPPKNPSGQQAELEQHFPA
jgi:hypothetical protein